MLLDGKLMSGNLVQTSGQLIDGELYPRVIETGGGGSGGVDFTTDEKTITLSPDKVLSVMTTDQAVSNDPRPITAQGVYNEFAVLNALLKTI